MIQISPQQKIWIDIRMKCASLGYTVFDYLPDSNTAYPFVFIGEQFNQGERIHKDHLNGRTQVTVHVWHNDVRKRGTLSSMMSNIETIVRQSYKSNVIDVSTQTLGDNSIGSDLLHGILDINIKY